jgi:hypothetical protein
MSANTESDAILKKGLLDDVFSILNLEKMYLFLYSDLLAMKSRLAVSIWFIKMARGLSQISFNSIIA